MLERSVGGIFKHFQAHDFHIGSKQKNCIFININEIWEFSVAKIDICQNKTLIKQWSSTIYKKKRYQSYSEYLWIWNFVFESLLRLLSILEHYDHFWPFLLVLFWSYTYSGLLKLVWIIKNGCLWKEFSHLI